MQRKMTMWTIALASVALTPGYALAGVIDDVVPAPGIIGLVALGVVGAIAIARHRK